MLEPVRLPPIPPTLGERLHRLGGLLARWHQWRKHYSPERGYARQGGPPDPEDALEQMLMTTIEAEVARMTIDQYRAVQHVARAECLGVEVDFPGDGADSSQHRRVLTQLAKRLIEAGVL